MELYTWMVTYMNFSIREATRKIILFLCSPIQIVSPTEKFQGPDFQPLPISNPWVLFYVCVCVFIQHHHIPQGSPTTMSLVNYHLNILCLFFPDFMELKHTTREGEGKEGKSF